MIASLCQMTVRPGRIDANLRTMEQMIAQARDAGAKLVVFPELCVSGYLLGDRWNDPWFLRETQEADTLLGQLSAGITVVYGNVYVDPERRNRDGRERKYNAGRVWHDAKPVKTGGFLPDGLTIKSLQPNYRFFDDDRHFTSLLDLAMEEGRNPADYLRPFPVPGPGGTLNLGVQLCEDLWFGDYPVAGAPFNGAKILQARGASLILNLSASPWTFRKNAARHRRVAEVLASLDHPVPYAYVNCTGVQNNGKNFVTFDGSSAWYAADGCIRAMVAEAHGEALLTVSLPLTGPALRFGEENRAAGQYRAIVASFRALDELMGRSDWPLVIGLSGGVDSAVSAAVASKALGGERVLVCNLPTRYNSDTTRSIAATLARELGLHYKSIPIQSIVDSQLAVLEAFSPKELHRENIQAKTRGTTILSNIAGITGGLMVNNGNKVEIALGYATLYGDVNGALAPLGDLLKTDVFALARYLNETVFGRELIPETLLPDAHFNFAMPPSAELKEAQRDPMKWGYHDAVLERVCTYRPIGLADLGTWFLEGRLAEELGIDPALLELYGLTDPAAFVQDTEWFFRLFAQGVYKRIQAPPIVVTSRSAFGFDLRESQLPWTAGHHWQALRQRLLQGRG